MSETRTISARSPKLGRETVVSVNWGANPEESVKMFGAEAVDSNAFANGRVTVQAGIRRGHENGKSDEEIQADFKNWKLGVAVTGGAVDPIQASLAKFAVMSEKEQKEYIKKLQAAAAKAA